MKMQPSTHTERTCVDAPLSPQWAFVVQFRAQLGGGAVYSAGRVEHLVSGRTTHFASLEELATYFAQELRQHDRSSA
jgi:hypothetical protein